MTDSLKLIDKVKTIEFVDIGMQSGHINKAPTVRLGDTNIHVTVSAVKKMDLYDKTHVRFSFVRSLDKGHINRLYIRPLVIEKDKRTKFDYLINHGEKSDGKSISGVTTLYRQIPRLKKIIEGRFSNTKIEIKECDQTGFNYIPIGANFEDTVTDFNKVPKIKAIYKISYRGNVQNIGETNNLQRRLKEKGITQSHLEQGIKEIPFDLVEYSNMDDATDEQRFDCEWEHLELHKKQHGSYPPFNFQSGRRVN
jgi:hypothetical protein